jgi:chemotaxis protein CheC
MINNENLDTIKKICTISSGNAAIALSQMVGNRVNIGIDKVKFVPSVETIDNIGGAGTLGAGIYCKILNEIRGVIILFFNRLDALTLVNTLMPTGNRKVLAFSEMEFSALKEAGNILAASYLNTISMMLGLNASISIPKIVFDNVEYVIDSIYESNFLEEKGNQAIITEFIESSCRIKGYFVLMLNKEYLEKIFQTIQMKNEGMKSGI